MEGLCGRVKRGGISNMLGQMHGPTVVCHSCRFRSFQYILVPSKRFLLSPFPFSYNRLPLLVAFFIQPPLPSVLSLSYRAFLAPTSLAKPSRSAFFSSFSRNYSFYCCMHGYIQSTIAWGYFLRRLRRRKVHVSRTCILLSIYVGKNLYSYASRFKFFKGNRIKYLGNACI